MSDDYCRGSYVDDRKTEDRDGWFVGHFMPPGPQQTNTVEIKYWEFPAGPTNHSTKSLSVIECTLIIKGTVKGIIAGKEIILSEGEYVVINPNVVNNLVVKIIEDAAGITIKAPSIPGSKRVVKDS